MDKPGSTYIRASNSSWILKISVWWNVVLATLRALEVENIWEKLHLLELLPNYLASSFFPIGSLDDLWIPIGPASIPAPI